MACADVVSGFFLTSCVKQIACFMRIQKSLTPRFFGGGARAGSFWFPVVTNARYEEMQMALRLEDKEAIVASVHEKASVALSAVIADYRGLTVGEMTELRRLAREQGVYAKIVRNTLARRAVVSTEFECLQSAFVGPTLVGLSLDDPGAAARLFKDFARTHENLKVRALAVGGKSYEVTPLTLKKLPQTQILQHQIQ